LLQEATVLKIFYRPCCRKYFHFYEDNLNRNGVSSAFNDGTLFV